MENDILLEKVSKLPANLKLELNDFVDVLLSKNLVERDGNNRPVFGSGEGMFVIKPGFDEPLKDFSNYI